MVGLCVPTFCEGGFQMENQKATLLLVSLIGTLVGFFVLALADPPADFLYLLPAFALTGLSAANFTLVIILQATTGIED